MAFRATLTGGPDGVFRGDGVHTDTIVTAGATYSSFLASEINDDGTVGIASQVERAQQVEVGRGAAGAANRSPGFALAPLGVDADQRIARGSI